MNAHTHATVTTLPARADVETVSVVIDGWNTLLGAADGFGYSRRRLSTFTLDLPRLADVIATMRQRPSRVSRIGIVLGTHDAATNRVSHAAQVAMIREWRRDRRVVVVDPGLRRVESAPGEVVDLDSVRYREVDGDTEIQRLLTEWTDDCETRAAVLVSADSDHQATITDIRRRRRTHLELARWDWQCSSLYGDKLWTHPLDTHTLDAVTRDRDPRKAA